MDGNDARVAVFGRFRYDFAAGRLMRGGEELPLPPRGHAVLRVLLERAGTLVDKPTLLAAAWNETAVTEGSLSEAVRLIRRALQDRAQRKPVAGFSMTTVSPAVGPWPEVRTGPVRLTATAVSREATYADSTRRKIGRVNGRTNKKPTTSVTKPGVSSSVPPIRISAPSASSLAGGR